MRKLKYIVGSFFLALVLWLVLPMRDSLNDRPQSYILFDRDGDLLGARISADGQWRFPAMDSIPEKFETALLTFEDKDFYSHMGVDLSSVCRATYQNVKHKRVVSGASTLTMQLMRLQNPHSKRSVLQKLKEMAKAFKAECHYSKAEIINQYSTHAPFGGNVVGLETASWRYFGKSPFHLSWAESAMLAVLPNAPALIHPGKNREKLLNKRNRLLKRLLENESLDSMEYQLALLEPIAPRPDQLPNNAAHFLEFSKRQHTSNRCNASLDLDLQLTINGILNNHYQVNQSKGIFNGAILVVDNYKKEVLAYAGNTAGKAHENYNDMVQRPRSSGSILKPVLYAMAIEDGMILPDELAQDIPISINGFSPKNYNLKFNGAIPYSQVISKSLNVPSVTLLQAYGPDRFLNHLRSMGISTLNQSAGHYGLPLILGGGEVNLWDLCRMYSGLATIMNDHNANSGKYDAHEFRNLSFQQAQQLAEKEFVADAPTVSAGAVWAMLEAMKKVERPDHDGNWEKFQSSKNIHWKTGTSYGHKDAWAVGVTPQYTVGVWMGNATGEGRPDIVGVSASGSVLFDVFNVLDIRASFEPPFNDLEYKEMCVHSGMIAGAHCVEKTSQFVNAGSFKNNICKYHHPVLLHAETGRRTFRNCADHNTIDTSWFVLPPTVAHYYKRKNPFYAPMPQLDDACDAYAEQGSIMEFIYPKEDSELYLPVNLQGEKEKCVFEASHKNEDSTIYWHLDDRYLGKTEDMHSLALDLEEGEYVLSIQDESGMRLSHRIKVWMNERSLTRDKSD